MFAILDRDGVINRDCDNFIKSPDEWNALPGSLEAIAKLNQAGWKVVIATNQSGLGRGLFSMQDLNAIHNKMRTELAAVGGHIDAIFICPHHPDDHCLCRKPLPGLFDDIQSRFEIDLSKAVSVGDSLRDLHAANTAGCKTWLVLTGNGQRTLASGDLPSNCQVRPDLAAVVNDWLGSTLC